MWKRLLILPVVAFAFFAWMQSENAGIDDSQMAISSEEKSKLRTRVDNTPLEFQDAKNRVEGKAIEQKVRSDEYVRANESHFWTRTWDSQGWILWRENAGIKSRVGWYSSKDKTWWPYAGETEFGHRWGPSTKSPPPFLPPEDDKKAKEFGVCAEKIRQGGFWLSGKGLVSKEFAIESIGSQLPDTSGKLRVTIIGSEEERKRIADEIVAHPNFSPVKEKVIIQTYGPDHWHIQEVGFATKKTPCIYAQADDGRVLHRQSDYQGGASEAAKAIAIAVESLRKPDPAYDPEKDCDLRMPKAKPMSPFAGVPISWVILGAVAILVVVLASKKKA